MDNLTSNCPSQLRPISNQTVWSDQNRTSIKIWKSRANPDRRSLNPNRVFLMIRSSQERSNEVKSWLWSRYNNFVVWSWPVAPSFEDSSLEFKLENRKLNFSLCRRNLTSSRYSILLRWNWRNKPFWDSYLPYLIVHHHHDHLHQSDLIIWGQG